LKIVFHKSIAVDTSLMSKVSQIFVLEYH